MLLIVLPARPAALLDANEEVELGSIEEALRNFGYEWLLLVANLCRILTRKAFLF